MCTIAGMKKHAEPILRTALVATGFAVGCIVGLAAFTDKMVGNWTPFIGAAGGAITTVLGMAWLSVWRDERAKADARHDIVRSMCPYLITLRGVLFSTIGVMGNGLNPEGNYFRARFAKANDMWQLLLPMLSEFPETAVPRYRMDVALKQMIEGEKPEENGSNLRAALKIAVKLAARFDADEEFRMAELDDLDK